MEKTHGQIAHEAHGVGERGGKLNVIIEGHISVSGCVADHTRQGRLAALARAVERLADLILNFVKKDGVDSQNIRTRDPDGIERSKPEPRQGGHTEKKKRR
jgi:hypothetical protein